jgi:hypothetical protein
MPREGIVAELGPRYVGMELLGPRAEGFLDEPRVLRFGYAEQLEVVHLFLGLILSR